MATSSSAIQNDVGDTSCLYETIAQPQSEHNGPGAMVPPQTWPYTSSAESWSTSNPLSANTGDECDIVPVSHENLKNFILDPKTRTTIVPFLFTVAGIPECGHTEALKCLFRQYKLSSAFTEVPVHTPIPNQGVTWYELVCVQDNTPVPKVLYHAAAAHTCYFNAAYSAVNQKFCLASQHATYGDEAFLSLFKDPLLNKSLHELYTRLGNPNDFLEGTYKHDFKRILPKGLAYVNMWNIDSSKSIFYFLPFLSNQLSSNYFWLFFDQKHDAENMDLPPVFPNSHPDKELLMVWRSRLYYLLRNVYYQTTVAKKATNRRQCKLFCLSDQEDQADCEQNMEKCKKAISQLAAEMKIQHLIHHEEIIELLYSQVHTNMLTCKPLKKVADHTIAEGFKHRSKSPSVRLSWIFLRGAFYESGELYITKESLREKASELKMSDKSFGKFCKFFSSFGSIIDASKLGSKSPYIILKPVEFFSMLDKLLYHDTDLVRTYGLATHSVLVTVYSTNAKFFINILLSADLATTLNRENIVLLEEKDSDAIKSSAVEKLYYIPIACSLKSVRACNPSALHLQITGHVLCRNIHATFTKKFLKLQYPFCKIVFKSRSNVNSNRTSYAYKNLTFDMICHGNEVEFVLNDDCTERELYQVIIDSCYKMITHFIEKEVSLKLNFSFLCSRESSANQQFQYNRKRHQLPVDVNDDVCEECKTMMSNCIQLQMWNQVLGNDIKRWQELLIKDEQQESLSLVRAMNLAESLQNLSLCSIELLAEKLEINGIKNIISGYKGSKRIMIIILHWEREKIGEENDTLSKLKTKLTWLKHKCQDQLQHECQDQLQLKEDLHIVENALLKL